MIHDTKASYEIEATEHSVDTETAERSVDIEPAEHRLEIEATRYSAACETAESCAAIEPARIDNGNDRGGNQLDVTVAQRLARSQGLTRIVHRELSYAVVGAAIEVHRRIGPGVLEAAYQRALASELRFREIPFVAQAPITFTYRGDEVGDYFADFIIDGKIVIELKAVTRILPVHRAQLYSYLCASDLQLGLLINFNVAVLTRGVSRVVR